MAPNAMIDRMRGTPCFIDAGKLLIERQPFTATYSLQQIDRIGLFHIAAGAIAGVKPVPLHSSEYGNLFPFVQRQHAIVF